MSVKIPAEALRAGNAIHVEGTFTVEYPWGPTRFPLFTGPLPPIEYEPGAFGLTDHIDALHQLGYQPCTLPGLRGPHNVAARAAWVRRRRRPVIFGNPHAWRVVR